MQALRRTAQFRALTRGGGHPDFPPVTPYMFKRSLALHDPIVTVFDGAHPEPLLDTTMHHLPSSLMMARHSMFFTSILVLSSAMLYFYLNQMQQPYIVSTNGNPNSNKKALILLLLERKSMERPSLLGHNLTPSIEGKHTRRDAWIHGFYGIN